MADSETRPLLRLRSVSVAVLCVVIAVTFGAFFGVRSVVASEERTLLAGRAREAAALVNTALASLPATFGALLQAGTLAGGSAFASSAASLLHGGFTAIALVGPGDRVERALGTAPAPGTVLAAPAVTATLARAAGSGRVEQSAIYRAGGQRVTAYALSAGGQAVLAISPVRPYLASTPDGAFHELDAAIYDGPRASAAQLLFTNARSAPAAGATVRTVIGSSVAGVGVRWLLVVGARTPLVGAAAQALPWIMLGCGLVLALALAGTVEAQARRRRYALALVDERTTELRSSLAELERTQQQLVQRERLAGIGQLASAVGHELRNPLGVLTNVLFLLRSKVERLAGGSVPADVSRHLDTAEREVVAAELIVSDLLEFARARDPVPVPVDLGDLVQEAVHVAPAPAGVSVSVSVEGGTGALRADRDQLRQVLLNLLANAYQAMPEGGRVTVVVRAHDGFIQLRVGDDGGGVSPEVADRLFEPFFTTKPKGVGLGLSVCRRIAEAHGGTLRYEPGPDGGAVFVLAVPVTLPQPRSKPDGDSPAGAAATTAATGGRAG